MVNNNFLTGVYKDAIVFFLENLEKSIDDIAEKINVNQKDLLQQINNAMITLESTPYYCIIKFSHNGFYDAFHNKTIEIQVIRENVSPTVFHMYLTNNVLYEFEYYKADSSEISNEELFDGDIVLDVY